MILDSTRAQMFWCSPNDSQELRQEFAGCRGVSYDDGGYIVHSSQRYIANKPISLAGRNNTACMIGLEQSNGHKVCCISGSMMMMMMMMIDIPHCSQSAYGWVHNSSHICAFTSNVLKFYS